MSPKFTKMAEFRDSSSDDDTRYVPIGDNVEKTLLEQSESAFPHKVPAHRLWKSPGTVFQAAILTSLFLSLLLNVFAWSKFRGFGLEPPHSAGEQGKALHPLLTAIVWDLALTARPVNPHWVPQSPLERDIGVHYHEQFINGSFEKKTIYRGKASKEVDDAWLALGTDGR